MKRLGMVRHTKWESTMAYCMAEIYEEVMKVVIVRCGIRSRDDQNAA